LCLTQTKKKQTYNTTQTTLLKKDEIFNDQILALNFLPAINY